MGQKKDDWGKWNWMLVSIAAGLMRPKWQQNTAKTRKRHIKYGKISAYMNSICFYRNDYSCIVNMRNFHSDPICYNEHEKKETRNTTLKSWYQMRVGAIISHWYIQFNWTHKIKLDRTNANQSYWVYCIFFSLFRWRITNKYDFELYAKMLLRYCYCCECCYFETNAIFQ